MPTYKNNTSKAIVETVKDSHGMSVNFRFNPGQQIATEYILSNVNLTEVDAAPYYNPLEWVTTPATSTGPGDDKTVAIRLITKTIAIINLGDAIVTAFLRSTSNAPGMLCYPNSERLVEVGYNVNQIVFQFAAAGTVYVEQRK